MAHPVVAGKGAIYNTSGSAGTSHAVAVPASVASGDLLIVTAGIDGSSGAPSMTGFTVLTNAIHSSSSTRFWAAYKIAAGTESGTITLTTPNEQVVAQMWRITGWHGSTPPEVATADGNSAAADPPSLTPSWGSADTLWIAGFGINGGHGDVTGWPLPDDNVMDASGGGGSVGWAACSDGLTQATLNPGTFTQGSSQNWVAGTIAVSPTLSVEMSAALTGSATATATGTKSMTALSASLTGSATTAATGKSQPQYLAATLTGSATVSATGRGQPQHLAASLTGSASVSATGAILAVEGTNQTGFRFRADDSQGLNAAFVGGDPALNTNATMSIRSRFRLRFLIQRGTGALTDGFTLEYRVNAGTWTDAVGRDHHLRPIDQTIEEVTVVPSDQYADLAATTQLLGSGSFVGGDGCETPSSGSVAFSGDDETEIEFCLKVHKINQSSSLHLADGDEIEFRLTLDDGTALDGYQKTPKLTVANDPGWIGTTMPEMGGDFGPHVDSNGNLYIICERTESDNTPTVMKSVDNGVSWIEMDYAGRPATTDMEGCASVLEGDEIHIFHQDAPVLTYHSFLVSSHGTNPDTWNVIDQQVDGAAGAKSYSSDSVDVVWRSGSSDLVVISTGNDGTDACMWVRSGVPGTWDTRFEIDSQASTDFATGQMCVGEGGVIHLLYQDNTNGNLYHRELGTSDPVTSSDLGTRTTISTNVNPSGGPPQSFASPVYYDDAGEENVVVGYHLDSTPNANHFEVNAMVEGSLGTAKLASDAVTEERVVDHEGAWDKSIAVHGTTIYAFWIDGANEKLILWAESDDLGDFSTPATFKDMDVYSPNDQPLVPEWDGMHVRVITHGGGTVLAVMASYAAGGSGLSYFETPLTVTHALAAALTGSGTAAATGGRTAQASAALTGSATAAATGTRIAALSAAATGSATSAATGTRRAALSAAVTGSAATAATGSTTIPLSAALTGSATTAATGSRTVNAQASLTGSGTAAAIGARIAALSASVIGSASVTATGARIAALSAALTGSATTAVTGGSSAALSAALTGSATTAATGVKTIGLSATLTGSATAAATGTRRAALSATLTGSAATAATGARTAAMSAALSGSATADAVGTTAAALAASLTGSGTAAATGARTVNAQASLTGSGTTAAIGSRTAQLASALTGSATTAALGSTAGNVPLSAALTGSATTSATGSRTANAQAAVTGSASASATGQRTAQASASLTGSGTAAATGARTAPLSTSITGAATAAAVGVRTAEVQAALTGSGTASASGFRTAQLASAPSGSATVSALGATAGNVPLKAALTGSATTSATGSRTVNAQAAVTGSGTAAAVGSRTANSSASLTGSATAAAAGTRVVPLNAALTAAAAAASTGTRAAALASTLTGSGTAAATGTQIPGVIALAATLTGSATAAAIGARTVHLSAGLTGSATVAAVGLTGIRLDVPHRVVELTSTHQATLTARHEADLVH